FWYGYFRAMTAPAKAPAESVGPVIYYVDDTGQLRRDLKLSELADAVKAKRGHLWVDIRSTDRQCHALLENVFQFHALAIEDAQHPNSRVKVDEYPGFLFVIIRGVRFQEGTEDPYDLDTFNIAFFLGPNYLV